MWQSIQMSVDVWSRDEISSWVITIHFYHQSSFWGGKLAEGVIFHAGIHHYVIRELLRVLNRSQSCDELLSPKEKYIGSIQHSKLLSQQFWLKWYDYTEETTGWFGQEASWERLPWIGHFQMTLWSISDARLLFTTWWSQTLLHHGR